MKSPETSDFKGSLPSCSQTQEENLTKYDRIYIVQDETLREANSIQEVRQRMLEVTA